MTKWILCRRDINTGALEYLTSCSPYAGFSKDVFRASQHDEVAPLKAAVSKNKRNHRWTQKWDQSSQKWINDPTNWEFILVEIDIAIKLDINTGIKL